LVEELTTCMYKNAINFQNNFNETKKVANGNDTKGVLNVREKEVFFIFLIFFLVIGERG